MQTKTAQLAFKRRRGDDSFVTLLFVVAAPLAAAVFALTNLFIAPTDSTLGFVPKDAVAYVHASGPTAVAALLASSVDMPSGVRPDEAARFAVPGDEGLRSAIFLTWRWPRVPTDAEASALRDQGARMLDERRAVFGDSALALQVMVSSVIDASAKNVPGLADELARMRALHGVQGFMRPTSLPDGLRQLAEDANGGEPLIPVVFGATVRDGSVIARIRPMESGKWPAPSSELAAPTAKNIGAAVTLTEASSSFDIVHLLFSAHDATHPAPKAVEEAADVLRTVLDDPRVTWLSPGPEGTAYLVHLPSVSPAAAKEAVGAYAAALVPERSIVTLPDGDIATEYRITPQETAAGMTVFRNGEGTNAVYVGDDGKKGTLIASSAAMFAAFREAKPDNRTSPFCDTPFRLTIDSTALSQASEWRNFSTMLASFGLSTLSVGYSVEKEVHICGY